MITIGTETTPCQHSESSYYDGYCSPCFHHLFPNDPRTNERSKLNGTFLRSCANLSVQMYPEYDFADCRRIKPLPFDAFCSDHNLLVELDGDQHFYQVKHFDKSKEDFISRVHNDLIKTRFAIKHKMLLRIAYNCLNGIEKILKYTIKMITESKFQMNEGIFFYNSENYLHYQNGSVSDHSITSNKKTAIGLTKDVYLHHCDIETPLEELSKMISQLKSTDPDPKTDLGSNVDDLIPDTQEI